MEGRSLIRCPVKLDDYWRYRLIAARQGSEKVRSTFIPGASTKSGLIRKVDDCPLLELVNIYAAMIGDETQGSVCRDPGRRHHWCTLQGRWSSAEADEMTHAAMSTGLESTATKAERPAVHSGEPIPLNHLRMQWREIARGFDDMSVVLWNVRRTSQSRHPTHA
jgi:hypothetical protein